MAKQIIEATRNAIPNSTISRTSLYLIATMDGVTQTDGSDLPRDSYVRTVGLSDSSASANSESKPAGVILEVQGTKDVRLAKRGVVKVKSLAAPQASDLNKLAVAASGQTGTDDDGKAMPAGASSINPLGTILGYEGNSADNGYYWVDLNFD